MNSRIITALFVEYSDKFLLPAPDSRKSCVYNPVQFNGLKILDDGSSMQFPNIGAERAAY